MKYLVVGCGLTGAVIARRLAEKGNRVTVLERRNHVGGNMYDYLDFNGNRVHKYGPHVFHTNSTVLKDYINRFSPWVPFRIYCRVQLLGKLTPSPFNFKTIDDFYPKKEAEKLKYALREEFPGVQEIPIQKLLESQIALIRRYALFLYENDYLPYTAKQWGIPIDRIDPSVISRVPVRLSYQDGYFNDVWQIIPKNGYTHWFNRLLDHRLINIHLNVDFRDYFELRGCDIYVEKTRYKGHIYYTGMVDELMNFRYGCLPYRSVKFKKEEGLQKPLEAPLIAFPGDKKITRRVDYSLFPQGKAKSVKSVGSLVSEYPVPFLPMQSQPYYPVLTERSLSLHKKYIEELSKIPCITCCGRLADFRYYNMDQALERAISVTSVL